jgi:glycosyltransferase involved in cell wall biosynthesis
LNNLIGKAEKIDFIGSSIHMGRNIHPSVRFFNLRGAHDEKVVFYKKMLRVIKYHMKLLYYISTAKATVLHVQWVRFPIVEGILMTLFMQLLGKKVIYTVHDVLPHSKDNVYNRFIYRILYSVQDQLIAHTQYIKNRIVAEFGIRPAKIHVIPHGVYERMDNPAITRETARNQFNIDPSKFIILFFGFIAEYKGFDLLLESIRKFPDKSRIQVLVAGRISADYEAEFRQLISDPDMKDNLILLLRFIRDDEIEPLFKAANVTALPYREASQSGVLFMSYSYGIPVIVPALGGFPDDVVQGFNGYIFEKGNAESLLQAIIEISGDESFADGKRSNDIRRHAAENYSWDKSCSMMVKVYETSLGKN